MEDDNVSPFVLLRAGNADDLDGRHGKEHTTMT